MVKFLISLALAIAAAFTILFAGLIGGARISTMLLRALAGWFVAGAAVYLILMICELKGWMAFDKDIAEPPQGDLPEPGAGETGEPGEDSYADEAGVPDEEMTDDGQQPAFQPMQTGNLTHIEAPPES